MCTILCYVSGDMVATSAVWTMIAAFRRKSFAHPTRRKGRRRPFDAPNKVCPMGIRYGGSCARVNHWTRRGVLCLNILYAVLSIHTHICLLTRVERATWCIVLPRRKDDARGRVSNVGVCVFLRTFPCSIVLWWYLCVLFELCRVMRHTQRMRV